jgi:septal ring factor EnvC (AmiA/AmiB activator)
LIGREEPLKLLLNQQDPSRAGRMFAYYGYFGRARAGQVEQIAASVRELDVLDSQLAGEDQRLSELETERRADLDRLEQARTRRSEALTSLTAQSRSRAQTLERLQREQSGLENLLHELRRALEKFPLDNSSPFAQLRGKLAWPVNGQIVARYGETRAGGVKWDGVLFATERGAQVRAIYQGRVIFADWLPGLGLLTIIDHGDGYLSLYGHNERLFKAVGESVGAGEAIAAAGDTGGSTRPELYFEIRRGGRPVDPRPWFKSP